MKLNPTAKVFLPPGSYSSPAQESIGINYDDNILDAYSKLNNLRVANVNRIINGKCPDGILPPPPPPPPTPLGGGDKLDPSKNKEEISTI